MSPSGVAALGHGLSRPSLCRSAKQRTQSHGFVGSSLPAASGAMPSAIPSFYAACKSPERPATGVCRSAAAGGRGSPQSIDTSGAPSGNPAWAALVSGVPDAGNLSQDTTAGSAMGVAVARASTLLAMGVAVHQGSVAGALTDLQQNKVFMGGFWSWLIAQVLKVFTKFVSHRKWDWKMLLASGGMPSSHSSLCMGVTTSLAVIYGLSSHLFPISLAFSLIVMYDAAGVRRHAGKQAEVVNKIVAEMFEGHPLTGTQLKEVLGHTPLQVVCGCLLGVAVPLFLNRCCW